MLGEVAAVMPSLVSTVLGDRRLLLTQVAVAKLMYASRSDSSGAPRTLRSACLVVTEYTAGVYVWVLKEYV